MEPALARAAGNKAVASQLESQGWGKPQRNMVGFLGLDIIYINDVQTQGLTYGF